MHDTLQQAPGFLTCPACGRPHAAVPLRRGERALCLDCGETLAHRSTGTDTPLAWTLAAAVLACPALLMPLVVVRKFGAEQASYLWSGIEALWDNGMPLLSVWVALCGVAVPLLLLLALLMITGASRLAPISRGWTRFAVALQHWSMPEVHILAVLVAFIKIGVLVQVEPGAGLWFYAAMTVALLFAWRTARAGGALA